MSASHTWKRRLDSWKEIAAHLGRTERTAIRWEKKGLPVHRVPGGQRQAVFAYAEEIDAWLISQDGTLTPGSSAEQPTQSDAIRSEYQLIRPVAASHPVAPQVKPQPILKWRILTAVACVLALAATVNFLLAHSHPLLVTRSVGFKQLTDDGRFKINVRADGTTLYFNEVEVARTILVSKPIAGGPVRKIPTPFDNIMLQDVSNDGRSLLVTSFEGLESEKPLWTIPVEGGAARRIGDVLCEWAKWSPDNRKIACASGTSVLILGSDGSDVHTVASLRSIPSKLLWSPDAHYLRFVARDSSNSFSAWQINFGEENGQEAMTLTKLQDGKDVCSDWAWTRKGDQFACLRYDFDHQSSLLVQSSDGSPSTWPARAELPVKLQTLVGLAPGRLDNSLFVLVENLYHGELLKLDTKRRTFETYLHGLSAEDLSFSRDHQWMTYVSSMDHSLWRSRVDGTEALQLTQRPMEVELSSWSPDGSRIAFMAKEPGKPWRIFLVSRDGGKPTEAADGSDNQGAPTWSPDGKGLVYANVDCSQAQMCWVRRVEIATGKTETLPGSHGLRTARWSPDGKYIAALRPATEELMLFSVSSGRWIKLANSINGDNINWSSDSRAIFADSPHGPKPIIERINIGDRHRTTVANLAPLQNVFGTVSNWVGLTSDDSPILLHVLGTSEVYSVEWVDR